MTSVVDIFIRGFCVIAMAAMVLSGIILFVVGETIEHFTP